MGKIRASNIELLRIILTIAIIISHYAYHGFNLEYLNYGFNRYFISSLCFGNISVACFIIISGYFMIDTKITLKKILKLIGQVIFYSWGILLIAYLFFDHKDLEIVGIIKSIFPISYSSYWFATVYVCLMCLSPFINKFIQLVPKETLKKLILLLILIWFIIAGTIKADFGYSNLGGCFVYYLIGAYIKKYVKFDTNDIKINKIILFISILLLLLSIIVSVYVGYTLNIGYLYNHSRGLSSLNSILVLIISVSLFSYFLNLEIKNNQIINYFASCSFGVYLLHDNNLVRHIIWNDIFKNQVYMNSKYLIFHFILTIIIIYFICCIIDFLRQKILEPIYMKIIQKLIMYINMRKKMMKV